MGQTKQNQSKECKLKLYFNLQDDWRSDEPETYMEAGSHVALLQTSFLQDSEEYGKIDLHFIHVVPEKSGGGSERLVMTFPRMDSDLARRIAENAISRGLFDGCYMFPPR